MSHRLDEIMDLTSRVTVVRDGPVEPKLVRGQLVAYLTGRPCGVQPPIPAAAPVLPAWF